MSSFYQLDYRYPGINDATSLPSDIDANSYALNDTVVLSGNTLGSSITHSSLTSLGTLVGDLNVSAGNLQLNGNGVYGVTNINTPVGQDLTFNAAGDSEYAFNTTSHPDQTVRIKDKSAGNSEALVRFESGNDNGIIDLIAANDGHAALYQRNNSFIEIGSNNQRVWTWDNVRNVSMRDFQSRRAFYQRLSFEDTTSAFTIDGSANVVTIKNKPSTNAIIKVPSVQATNNTSITNINTHGCHGRQITLIFEDEGTGYEWTLEAQSGEYLQGNLNGTYLVANNPRCIVLQEAYFSDSNTFGFFIISNQTI